MDFVKLTERTEYVSIDESIVAIYHLGGGRVVLIDAGAKEEPELVSALKERRLEVAALLCSHLHFDHISTAGLLYEEFHMPSYAHYLEEREKEFPTRYFPVSRIREDEPLIIEGERFELIFTPGHTKGHLAFVTPDSVCCVGDAFMSEMPLRLSKIPFFQNVDRALESMELIRQSKCESYLLCHEGPVSPQELDRIIDLNIDKELELYRMILDFVTEPMEIEEVITGFMKYCGIRNESILNFHGYRGTVRNRIMSLEYNGELRLEGQWVIPGRKEV